MLNMAECTMNNATNMSTGETPFYQNYGKHTVTPNVQEFGNRLTQVNTPCEGYEHFCDGLLSGPDSIILKYTEHFRKTLERDKLQLEQAQQRQKAYTNRDADAMLNMRKKNKYFLPHVSLN